MGIIGEVERHITDVHRENNAILLGDTGKILQDIIKKDDVPFIYERLGVKLRHYLIDEFQDTSRLQWYDIRPLIDESLAGGNDNLIIGDEKQAIYRFRNSDPSLIVKDVPDTFRRQGELDLHGESIDENRNWRSAREIVQFNNALFVQLSKELNLYSDIYANIVQDVAKKNLPGFVEVKSYNDENESLVRMVENVRRQLDSGYHQKDIAVLCARRDECGMVVNYLMNAAKKPDAGKLSDLKIITEEALIVGNSPAVRQIVGVLRFVDAHVSLSHRRDSKRKVTAAEIVNRYEYFRSQGCEPSEAMAKSFSEEGKVADSAAIEVAKMECTSVPSVVERIIASDFIDKDTCNNDNIYITAFQDMVVDFCSHGSGDLHSFMKWWDENGSQRSLIVPDGVDGVRVMTIHKSKGLEFACVHVPLLKGEFDSPDNMMWVPTVDGNGKLLPVFKGFNPDCVPPMIPLNAGTVGKMEMYSNLYDEAIRDESIDRLNQVYVAFTRASRELIIGYDCSSKIGVTMEKCFDELSQQRCDEIVADANKIGKQISCNLLVSLADKKKDIPVEPKKKPTDGDSIDNDPASGKKKKQKQPETLLLLTVGSSTSPGEEKAKDDDAPDIITMEPYYSFKNESIWDKVTIEDVESVSPRKTGIELHTVMGYIRRSSDIHRAVLKANMRGVISHDKMDEIEAMLNTEFAKPLVKVWFDGYTRLLRERSIAVRRENRVKVADGNNGNENDEVGDTLSHYRPDRVVWTSTGEIHIIDFKFGEELPRKYVRQLTGYMYLLRSLSAGLPSSDVSPNASSNKCAKVRGFIWYPLKSEIYEIINSVPVLQK
jgi:ATP-dependent exoDNAse (exonuclease V) beta subunit